MKTKIFWCKNCLNMSTRRRIAFDERGWCNACQWMEEKKTLDWGARQKELIELLERNRSKNGDFDCVIPVSGGKDGSYVAYMLKHKYGMNPLAITVRPALSLEIGDKNLTNFIHSGYDHVHLTPNPKVLDRLNKYGFIEKGFPYYGWLVAIMTAVIRTAANFKTPLIFYGEDGEVEYGGSTETKYRALYDINYIKRIYLEAGHEKVFEKILEPLTSNIKELGRITEEMKKSKNFLHTEVWPEYANVIEFYNSKHCLAALTDSGGVQEEMNLLGKPCFTSRFNTDRPETVMDSHSNLLVPPISGEFMAATVDYAVKNEAIMNTMRTAKKLYGKEVAKKFISIVKQLMEENRKPFGWAHDDLGY